MEGGGQPKAWGLGAFICSIYFQHLCSAIYFPAIYFSAIYFPAIYFSARAIYFQLFMFSWSQFGRRMFKKTKRITSVRLCLEGKARGRNGRLAAGRAVH